MFEGITSGELAAVILALPGLRPEQLRAEPGKIFVVRDGRGEFLKCFYQGRERTSSFPRHAMLFDNLYLAATFGRFWERVAPTENLPLNVDCLDIPRNPDIRLIGFG